MSKDMTGVYSGGLMYEYSNEPNNFGIVVIDDPVKSTAVKELEGFAKFQKALALYPAPTGDGGASTASNSVPCPAKGPHWDVEGTELPSLPKGADKFFHDGAGTGPGLHGPGSQNAGDAPPPSQPSQSGEPDAQGGQASSTSTPKTPQGKPPSGTEPTGAATSSKNAANGVALGSVGKAPFVVAALAGVLTLTGTLML